MTGCVRRAVRALLPPGLALSLAGCAIDDTVAFIAEPCAEDRECPPADTCQNGRCEAPVSCAADSRESARLCTAQSALPFAACACDGYVSGHGLTIDGAGSFGTNGAVNLTSPLVVDGDVVVAGTDGIVAANTGDVSVAGTIRVGGPIRGGVAVAIGRDAEAAGGVDVRDLTVGGTLRTPPGSPVSATGILTVGARETAAVAVSAPCSCDGALAPSIAALVLARRSDNDNAGRGLDPFHLDGFEGEQTLRVECGRYHLSRMTGGSALIIDVSGAVSLFVDGEIALDGAFTARLEPGATLELFVRGDLRVNGALTLGDPARPGTVQVFVAGSGTLSLAGPTKIAGSLVAPEGELVNQAPLELFGGALSCRRIAPNASVTVHYDPSLAEGLPGCR